MDTIYNLKSAEVSPFCSPTTKPLPRRKTGLSVTKDLKTNPQMDHTENSKRGKGGKGVGRRRGKEGWADSAGLQTAQLSSPCAPWTLIPVCALPLGAY